MFDELISHAGTSRYLLVLAESPNMPAGLNQAFIFPYILLLFHRGSRVGMRLPHLLLHIIKPLFFDFRSKIFHGLIDLLLDPLLQEDL